MKFETFALKWRNEVRMGCCAKGQVRPVTFTVRDLFMLTRSFIIMFFISSNIIAQHPPIVLRESTVPGRCYHVHTQTDLAGTLTLPSTKDKQAAAPVTVTGKSTVSY